MVKTAYICREKHFNMAILTLTAKKKSALLTVCDSGSREEFNAALQEYDLEKEYATSMGRQVIAAVLEETNEGDPVDFELFKVCERKDDMRCQVGQVKSNLWRRLKLSRRGKPEMGDNFSALKEGFEKFMNNVSATVLLLDKRGLSIKEPDVDGKIIIKSVMCSKALNLSDFGGKDKSLCKTFPYGEELVPDANILGSGFFRTHDSVVTAAHVLERALVYGAAPEDVLLIRGHYAYNSKAQSIEVEGDQLYQMDQTELIVNEQIRYGSDAGDMAWIKVKPYCHGKAFNFSPNGFTPALVEKGTIVYVLGHGLGLPMKLSYCGIVTEQVYEQKPSMFALDVHILPGNSGSPVFHADTHQMVGIIWGLHAIKAEPHPTNDCVDLKINMKGDLSAVATHIGPFTIL